MPTETILYGTKTAFASAANLASLGAGSSAALGVADNSVDLATGFKVEVNFTAGAATGTVDYLLIESLDNGTYTDGIAPAGTGVAPVNAVVVHTSQVTANGQSVYDRFDLPVLHAPKYWTLVVRNNTGAALAATAYSAYYTPIHYGA